MTIKSFRSTDTQALFEGRRVKRWVNIERAALRKLEQLEVSSRLDDLRVPPGNRLETLTGAAQGSTAFASTINGACASCGATAPLTTSRSSTTTERSSR